MKILITPDEIVRLCLWDNYVYYIAENEKEAIEKLRENKEFELSAKDALVLGVTKIIETDNLIHKFNTYITDFITNRASKLEDKNVISKSGIEKCIEKFMSNFPTYWEPNIKYKESLEDLFNYVNNFKDSINKMDVIEDTYQGFTTYYINVSTLKKEIKFNYM